MPDLCSTKCEHCGEWRAVVRTKKGKALVYCGKCRYYAQLRSKESIENFKKACQKISSSELPELAQKWLQDKIGEKKEEKEG